MSSKVERIRNLSVVKEQQKQQRRDNAIRHQEMLKSFLDTEKANRKDERPMQYANTSAFGPANDSIVESRSMSRSPVPQKGKSLFSQSARSNS